jgi:Tol biopolymer transport system component
MIGRRPVWILWLLCILAACSDKGTKPPGPPVEPIHLVEGYPSWSPDGRYIYYMRPCRDTIEWNSYGPTSIWAYDITSRHYGFLVGPAINSKSNPDGTILAFNWHWTLFFYYFQTRTVRQVTQGFDVTAFDWSPSGNRLIIGLGEGAIIDTLGNIIVPALLPWDGSHGGWRGLELGDWFEENRILVASNDLSYSGRTAILVIDTLGQIIDTVIMDDNPSNSFGYPAISPDQSKVAASYLFTTDHGRTNIDVRLFGREGNLLGIISPPDSWMGQWSPDGATIALTKYTWMGDNPDSIFDSDYGRTTVWICNPDGSDMQELLGWPQPAPDSTMFDGGYNWVTDIYAP